jgi:hypothetical protein
MKPWHIVLLGFVSMILVAALALSLRLIGVADTKYIAPVEQNAQTKVYEGTKAYQDGVRRDFEDLRLAYIQSKDPEAKAAILATMRHRAAGVPPELLPNDVSDLIMIGPGR